MDNKFKRTLRYIIYAWFVFVWGSGIITALTPLDLAIPCLVSMIGLIITVFIYFMFEEDI